MSPASNKSIGIKQIVPAKQLKIGALFHYENMPMQYTEIFNVVKNEKNQ